MTKTMTGVMVALVALGLMAPSEGIAAVEGDAALLAAAAQAQNVLSANSSLREGRQRKSDAELKFEADAQDYWNERPSPPPTEKEWCEGGGHHVFVISPKTGRKYCIPAFTDRGGAGEGNGERLKTKWEIDREVEANDSFPDAKPPTEKEWCEAGGHHVFRVSPKTGNKYCIAAFTERGGAGEGNGERLKTEQELVQEVATNDYFESLPKPPPLTPKQECERQAPEKVWVISSKGNGYCLNALND